MSEQRFALLIASSDYDDPYFRRLEAPARDVQALSCVLRDPTMGAFSDVKVLLNDPRDKLSLSIEEFLADRNPEDLLLLYFSGHGIKDEEGRLYFAAKNTLRQRLVSTALPAYQVNDLIRRSPSRRKILVIDCCYSGAFSRAYLAKGEASVGVMEEFRQGRGLVTLTSSDAYQYSFEGEEVNAGGAYSVFTRALVEGIETGKADEDGDQVISLDELYRYVYGRVRNENPQQSPHKSGEVEGDLIVARNPQPPRPAALPSKVQEAIDSPIPEVREGIVRTLDSFLHGRNKGLALAAREALQKLSREDDSLRVRAAAQKCVSAFEEEEASRLKAEGGRLTPESKKDSEQQVTVAAGQVATVKATPADLVPARAGADIHRKRPLRTRMAQWFLLYKPSGVWAWILHTLFFLNVAFVLLGMLVIIFSRWDADTIPGLLGFAIILIPAWFWSWLGRRLARPRSGQSASP